MLKPRKTATIAVLVAVLGASSAVSADVWRLGQDDGLKPVSEQDKFLVAVAEAKKLVNTGRTEEARAAFERLKKDFPNVAGADFDAFVEAELLYSQGNFTKAYRAYEKLYKDHPDSKLVPAVLDRQFSIGTAYLGGQTKTVLKVIKLKGDAEGVRIMEKITDRAGVDSPLGLRASLAIAENYEKRRMFNEAYLKWWEISLTWKTEPTAREALLGMARSKHAIFNSQSEERRALFDAANLITARTYYRNFKSRYPAYATKIGVDGILRQIEEQLSNKQLEIAKYYHRTDHIKAANLYYEMVVKNWPESEAAKIARRLRSGRIDITEIEK